MALRFGNKLILTEGMVSARYELIDAESGMMRWEFHYITGHIEYADFPYNWSEDFEFYVKNIFTTLNGCNDKEVDESNG